jgi:hypothetical protein
VEPGQPQKAARGVGLFLTNLTKLAGLVVAVNEALLRAEIRPVSLAVAAFMMSGAQGIETLLDKLIPPSEK